MRFIEALTHASRMLDVECAPHLRIFRKGLHKGASYTVTNGGEVIAPPSIVHVDDLVERDDWNVEPISRDEVRKVVANM
jgi:hypothetical protein